MYYVGYHCHFHLEAKIVVLSVHLSLWWVGDISDLSLGGCTFGGTSMVWEDLRVTPCKFPSLLLSLVCTPYN